MFTKNELASIAAALAYSADMEAAEGRHYTAGSNYELALKAAKMAGFSAETIDSIEKRAKLNEAMKD